MQLTLPRRINEFVPRERTLAADTAIHFARALNTSEQFWMGLQAGYDLEKAKRMASKELQKIENTAVRAALITNGVDTGLKLCVPRKYHMMLQHAEIGEKIKP